jgi:AcrR family transcriptional regulator
LPAKVPLLFAIRLPYPLRSPNGVNVATHRKPNPAQKTCNLQNLKYVRSVTDATVQESRLEIIEAAKVCLRKFGPSKLTVTDVARSLGMSHANVYRFFKSKSDLLDAIIDQWLTLLENFIQEIAARPLSASERIQAVVLDLHRKRKQKYIEDAEIFETFRRVVELRPEIMAERREKIIKTFERLLEEGMAAGEFKKLNPRLVAVALKDATALFLHPFMIPTTLNQDTDKRAKSVVDFILAGFLAESGPAAKSKSRPKRRP